MFIKLGLAAALVLVTSVAHGQSWDPEKSAKGWTRFDPINAATFFDPATRQLLTWMPEAGVTSQIDVSKAEITPEFWVVDDDRIWAMAGNSMKQLSKAGKVNRSVNLPAEVADADFIPPDGIALSYRTAGAYVERRDIKNGNLVWSYGDKPKKDSFTAQTLHRIFRNNGNNLVVMGAADFTATVLDGKKGSLLGQTVFAYNNGQAPALQLGTKQRGPAIWWWSSNVAFSTVASSTVPSLKQLGLLLVRMDFSASTIDFLPTGLTEGYTLVGILESRAVFIAPNGGMVYVPVK